MRSYISASVAALTAVCFQSCAAQDLPVGEHNYSSLAQPDLNNQTLDLFTPSFPDCSSGPLSKQLICNTSASYLDRATNLISLMSLEELINQTGISAPGVERIGSSTVSSVE